MTRLLNTITDTFADAALLEGNVEERAKNPTTAHKAAAKIFRKFFQSFSMGMADAALLEARVSFILAAEKAREGDVARPEECQYGDNEMCFRHAS